MAAEEVQAVPLFACRRCDRSWQTAFAGCPYCGSVDIGPISAETSGRIYSWVEIHRSLESPPQPVPYTVVCVSLDRGARVFGRWQSDLVPVAEQRVIATADVDLLTFVPGQAE